MEGGGGDGGSLHMQEVWPRHFGTNTLFLSWNLPRRILGTRLRSNDPPLSEVKNLNERNFNKIHATTDRIQAA